MSGMAAAFSDPGDLFYDARNTARPTRGRFRYQDECVALRCIANLIYGTVTEIIVEWSTDYIAILADERPELVSIKHRDPGQGDWQMSQLRHVIGDLHMVWRAMTEQCRCTFASNAGLTPDASDKLTNRLRDYLPAAVQPDEVARFQAVLAMPDPPLPRRTEITAVGVRDMVGALSLLDRDTRYAEDCYRALVDRIVAAASEQPDRPEQRIARLTGSMRAVNERQRPRQADQTLRIADLRDLVLRTHDECVRRPARPAASTMPLQAIRPRTAPLRDTDEWYGGLELQFDGSSVLIHDPVEVHQPPDRSYREQRSNGRQLVPRQRDVRVVRLDVVRPDRSADQRRQQVIREADLHTQLRSLPELIDRWSSDRQIGYVTAIPPGRSLPVVFGPPPYSATALDGLLRALPSLGRVLAGFHSNGLAHRALRPEALFLAGHQLRLLDAGLAAAPPAMGEGMPSYRAPEQERPARRAPTAATDVYQLAAIIYHLAVGQPPGPNPAPPSILRPELSPAIDRTLMAALLPEPGDRLPLLDLIDGCTAVLRSGGALAC
ncbi:hypothetical protein GCM10017581_004850 [Dactylosporangium matsuzakiense]|uniref:Protein kinase domain-containing protein n=2 Tax=Dactylosporangium matsuzakiense TaxID=53360 RepID=A0A9W6KEU1_9ACTN|nr:hypothetical protein GCM10017581_004850 [Dactylosporangium matsuzakiense]